MLYSIDWTYTLREPGLTLRAQWRLTRPVTKIKQHLVYYLLPPTAQIMIQHDLDAQWKSGECVLLILENCNKYAYSSHLITLD